ncbi:MAG: Si-specific NAD(P)(+) transhydrogenase [Planctomycetes bacterium]|nr:Si-specific NAD(P)(+) transhydrogenase [Planctomycetota bacterium]
MSSSTPRFDLVVIGSGPGGQKAAVQGAKLGKTVLLVERDTAVGGECVHRGTIPSKSLRESAVSCLRARQLGLVGDRDDGARTIETASLMKRQEFVTAAHETYISRQLERNAITVWRGHARFVSPWELEVASVDGSTRRALGSVIVVATGSRPRTPPNVPIDHESVLDSDSILSMIYVPGSLVVLGSGVIACEYASIFAALGTKVTLIDRAPRPLAFMEPELTARFVAWFERHGGRYVPGRQVKTVEWDGVATVTTVLDDGEKLESDKLLCALGRLANLRGLDVEAAGLKATDRGYLKVDEHCRTDVPHIYAVGDVIGPPALAATSMEQGRRAARHAFGLSTDAVTATTPIGIYTIPEMASVGLGEAQAKEKHGAVLVGSAKYEELARGQINGDRDGLLKLVASADGKQILGAHVIGESASELVHVAQMAMVANLPVETFVEQIFNFPTLAEAYRVAAFEILAKLASTRADSTPVVVPSTK